MVSNNNLRFTLDEILPLVESLPTEEKTEIVQQLLSKQSVLDATCLYGSVVGIINTMNRDELSNILKAIANRIAADGDIFRK